MQNVSLSSQSYKVNSSSIQLPGVAHQHAEVIIVVNIGTNCCVIVSPLLLCNDTITVFVSKAGQEFNEDFFWRHFSALNFRMHGAVINDAKIVLVNCTIAILIELAECLFYHFHSGCIRHSTDTDKEFIIAHNTILVGVEIGKQESSLIF